MKTSKIIFIAVLIVGLSSCASARKYNEAVSDKKALEQKYSEAQKKNSELQATNDKLEKENQQLKSNYQTEQTSLNNKQEKLQEMESLIDEEREAIANLKQEVCSALKCFTPEELKVQVRDGKLYISMSEKLLFPTGSDVVNARGKEAIKALSQVLSNSKLEVSVEGNTDNVPIMNKENKDNWDLSVRRATSVSRIMIVDGIKPERIIASGRGKYYPIASNKTAKGRQENRRTDIVLDPRLDKLWKVAEESQTSAMK
jgi:chemotaxis protein MotB